MRGADERVVRQQRGPVEVHEVHQRGDVRGGGDADRALDHAADHDHHPVRPGHGDHPERLTQAAALGQLDVDPVHLPTSGGMSRGGQTALVRDDRDLGPAGDLGEAVELGRRERLLQHGDAEFLQHRQHGDRLLQGPAAVGVDPDLLVGRVADGPQDLDVAVGAELDLEDRIRLRLPHLGADPLGGVEADGEGGARRLRRIESPQPIERHAQPLADQVVQRGRTARPGPRDCRAARAPSGARPPRGRTDRRASRRRRRRAPP